MNWKGRENMETRLVDLVGQWQTVADMMMDEECDQQAVLDTLEAIDGEIEVKADGYGDVIRKMEFEMAAIKARKEYVKNIADQFTRQEKHLDNQIKWMKEKLKEAMIATGKDGEGIKTDKFTFKVKKAGGVQKLDIVGDVPDNFKKIVYENDEEKIREHLKDHNESWARLLPRTTYLDIKGV